MVLTLFLFFLSAIIIYLSCEFFVNGIEWCGSHLKLGATAVGSVLAAFGTALPESAVTFMAVVCGQTPEEKSIGVGAAMGGPLVLSTLAYGITGLSLVLYHYRLGRRSYNVNADCKRLSNDQAMYLLIFAAKFGLGFVTFIYKPWLGILFLIAYALYVLREIHHADTSPEEEKLEPLKICPSKCHPPFTLALLQTFVAIIVIGFASHLFVQQISKIGQMLGWAPHFVALLLSPIATELPEIMNVFIWVKQGKERLALANISGSMMIQATIPSAQGIFFTPWLFDAPLIISGIITAIAIIILWRTFHKCGVDARKLACMGLLYALFIAAILIYFNIF